MRVSPETGILCYLRARGLYFCEEWEGRGTFSIADVIVCIDTRLLHVCGIEVMHVSRMIREEF
jgi:hypothetical protein